MSPLYWNKFRSIRQFMPFFRPPNSHLTFTPGSYNSLVDDAVNLTEPHHDFSSCSPCHSADHPQSCCPNRIRTAKEFGLIKTWRYIVFMSAFAVMHFCFPAASDICDDTFTEFCRFFHEQKHVFFEMYDTSITHNFPNTKLRHLPEFYRFSRMNKHFPAYWVLGYETTQIVQIAFGTCFDFLVLFPSLRHLFQET